MTASADAEAATRHGKLLGARADGVCAFRGVPYARALRFRPAQPLESWTGARDARNYGPCAPQNNNDPLAGIFCDMSEGQSEDCLTLNLWTPALDGGKRPVLVWIHGGRFLRGSASEIPIDGSHLARNGDVVVVALQYRLGPFGFLHVNHGRPWDSNLGLRDQIAALEWVRDEIAAFGGDPNNVTLAGQSAGAISAGTLFCSPKARGLFHRAILQSGPPVAIPSEIANPVSETLLRALQLGDPDLLRHVPVDTLLGVEETCHASPGSRPLGLPYMPVIEGDVLSRDPLASAEAGEGSSVPLMIGTTRDEMSAYLLIDPETFGLCEDGLRRRCADLIGDAAEETVEVYRSARAARGESTQPRDLWFSILTDRYVRQPSMRLAAINAARESRTFAYRFDWTSPFMEGALGACHSLEVPFIYGTLDDPRLAAFTGASPEASALASSMQSAWLSFMRSGSPGCQWPAYEASQRQTMVFGRDCSIESAPGEEERRFMDALA